MKIKTQKIEIKSKSQIEFIDITEKVEEVIANSGIREGQVLVYSAHTSVGVIINQNEPMLLRDFMKMLFNLIPIDETYSHDLFEIGQGRRSDGRSNGHSHCKSLLLGVSETVPIEKGQIMLSEKQSIFLVELDGARTRDFIVQVIGM